MQSFISHLRRIARIGYAPEKLAFSSTEASELIAALVGYGHDADTIREEEDSVWVKISPEATLQFQKGLITFHGEPTDDAIAAGLRHAQEAWNSKVHLHGSEDFKLRAWAMAQVAGIEVCNYTPPPHLMQQANNLVHKYSFEMFNRSMGVYNDGILDGRRDNRPWGYRVGVPSPRDREMMRRVERAMGLGRSVAATI